MTVCFPDEVRYLHIITEKLKTAKKRSDEAVSGYETEYRKSKRYLAEYRHEIDPKEIFTNEISIRQIESLGNAAVRARDKVSSLLDSPYFGRIDFCDGEETRAFYIGRFSFDEDQNILIYDWRAPVSNMFYECELGKAGYDAPVGRISGELTRKRQFGIRHGQMEYALESAVHILDGVLQRELSHTSDEKMKSIIATIQREQNRIIRNADADTLIIQGVAGSGKTSVALHRIAYLMYQQRDRLSACNIVIISPNKVFADYIAGVLPELGEEPVWNISFADIAAAQLKGGIRFEPERDPNAPGDPEYGQRVRFKSSRAFIEMMDRYLSQISETCFEPRSVRHGHYTVAEEWLAKRYLAYKGLPIKRRLLEMAEDLLDRFKTENVQEDEMPTKKAICRELTAMLQIKSIMALYRGFYRDIGAPQMLRPAGKQVLEWADVYPFLYCTDVFEGLDGNRLIRHLVIDEMQDFTPVQIAVINRLFACKKTILGDFNQRIHPQHEFTLTDFEALFDRASVVKLNKSYRATCEIMRFAKSILNDPDLETVDRHGQAPDIICCASPEEELNAIRKILDAFVQGPHATLGVITKTHTQANALYTALCTQYPVHLLAPDSEAFTNGISIASVRMSKGLEFDEVVIPSADYETYHTSPDRHLLYTGCTRAMHRLTLVCCGVLSPLVPTASG